jgi:hypothetical protein
MLLLENAPSVECKHCRKCLYKNTCTTRHRRHSCFAGHNQRDLHSAHAMHSHTWHAPRLQGHVTASTSSTQTQENPSPRCHTASKGTTIAVDRESIGVTRACNTRHVGSGGSGAVRKSTRGDVAHGNPHSKTAGAAGAGSSTSRCCMHATVQRCSSTPLRKQQHKLQHTAALCKTLRKMRGGRRASNVQHYLPEQCS